MTPMTERLTSLMEWALPGVKGSEFTRHFRRDISIAAGVVAVGWALFERAERRDTEAANAVLQLEINELDLDLDFAFDEIDSKEQDLQTAHSKISFLQQTVVEVVEERDDAIDARDAHEADALTDPLTGLPNFRALVREYNHCVEGKKEFGIIYGDVDAFKAVNDKLGHAAGDAFLTMTGSYLLNVTRPEDDATVTRKGGDEYAVLVVLEPREDSDMEMEPEDRLKAAARRMKKGFRKIPEIKHYNTIAPQDKKTGITIGYSLYRGQPLPTMLNEADPKGELGNKYLKLASTHAIEVPTLEDARAEFAKHLSDKPSK